MATLDSKDLGKVQLETQSKASNLFNQPLPTSDSDKSILLDLFGINRTITIEGIFSGSLTQQNTFITDIEGIQNGTQIGVTFVSSQTNTSNKTVFVQDFSWNFSAGKPNKVNYFLTLLEGALV